MVKVTSVTVDNITPVAVVNVTGVAVNNDANVLFNGDVATSVAARDGQCIKLMPMHW